MKPRFSVKTVPLWLALLLPLPALIPAAHAYLKPLHDGLVPTGFIQDDMPYYMANGREHFDQGFRITYGNPYAGYDTPAIYFQPHIFLLGCLQHLGLDPGVALNLFGLVALGFAALIAILFYGEVVGLETTAKRLAFVVFFWGGGILILTGFARALMSGQLQWARLWRFDISYGWWMFNFGRNLVYPTEAYYHGLFLLSLLLLLRGKTAGTLAVAALLSLSHPFTGLSLALVLLVYSAWEVLLRSKEARPAIVAGAALILLAHLGYYWVFLNRFSDHRALRDQWQLAWLYKPSTYLPALFFVGGLAIIRLVYRPGLRYVLQDSRNRLFLVWFVVVFGLSQHNLIVKPFQPIHFTHGYDWMALFFLSAPLLVLFLERVLSVSRPTFLRIASVSLVLLFLLGDNLAWFGSFLFPTQIPKTIALKKDQKAVLDWLNHNAPPRAMVICEDPLVSYLVSTYTSVRSWQGHMYNTPSMQRRRAEVKDAFQNRRILPDWQKMPVLYVSERRQNWQPPENIVELYHNEEFTISGRPPVPSLANRSGF
jgi:hypothetical protein